MLRTARALNHRVAVLGAGGGIGQPLSLLLKQAPTVSHLALFDVANPHGVAEDLSHICSPAKTSWAHGMDNIGDALRGTQVVVIPAGVPRKPGMTRDDLFAINAKILHGLGTAIADHCPEAHVCVISNPVNSMVPLVAEVLKQKGVFNPKTLYGVTTLDVVRAKTFLGDLQHADPRDVGVDVVGGHAGTTIVPVLGPHGVSGEMREAVTHDIQFGGDKVVKAKDGAGSATLSMAWSGAHFTLRLIDALSGSAQVEECCFVQTNVASGLPWFSSRVHLGMHGVERVYSLNELNLDAEDRKRVAGMTADLAGQITKGEDFTKNFK